MDNSDFQCSSNLEYGNVTMIVILTTCVSCRPINFINETKDRWAYAAVFGTLSGTFVQIIFDSNFVSSDGYGDSILRGKCACCIYCKMGTLAKGNLIVSKFQ